MPATKQTFLIGQTLAARGFGVHYPPDGTYGRAFLKARALTLYELESVLDSERFEDLMVELVPDSIGGIWFRAAE